MELQHAHPFKTIQSVQRAIDILNCFEATTPSLSINEISKRTNLNINTARGLINTLGVNGLLLRNSETGNYQLGFYFVGKADIIRKEIEIYISLFKPLVDMIAEKYYLTSSLQIVNQGQIFSVYCAHPSNRAYYIILSEYSNLPKHATSSGKLLLLDEITRGNISSVDAIEFETFTPHTITYKQGLLDQLETIRQNGYSLESEEFALDVGSIAVPCYDAQGHLVATISSTFFAKSLAPIKENLITELKSNAEKISAKFTMKENF